MERLLDCPHCSQPILINEIGAGREFLCPHCGGRFTFSDDAAPQTSVTPDPISTEAADDPSRPQRSEADRGSASRWNGKLLLAAGVVVATAAVPAFLFGVICLFSAPTDRRLAVAAEAPAQSGSSQSDVLLTGTLLANGDGPHDVEKEIDPPSAETRPIPAATVPAPMPAPQPVKAPPTATPPTASLATAATPQEPNADSVVPPKPVEKPAATVAESASTAPTSTARTSTATTSQPEAPLPPAGDTAALVARIEPSVVVVQVELEKGSAFGSGFPLDDRGTIATNYHVIEGAKSAKIKFGDKTADVEGFLVYAAGKDIAILRARLGNEKLSPLKLAADRPTKGETVLTFGAPLGFDSTVSNGIVSATRTGTELREIFKKLTGSDSYVERQHYDLDANWIQTTAPISSGNSGGPLVNLRGEVVGLNTWALVVGQNMNFAISAQHIDGMLASAGSGVHPLSELPAPRESTAVAGKGDRTLEYWNEVSKISRSLSERIARIKPVPIPSSSERLKAVLPKLAGIYRRLGELLPATADELKALNIDDVDPELVALVTVDALSLDKLAERARQSSLDIGLMSTKRIWLFDQKNLGKKGYGEFDNLEIGQAYDLLRIKLTNRYGLTFPSLFDERPERNR